MEKLNNDKKPSDFCDIDQETAELWREEIDKFINKGGFSSMKSRPGNGGSDSIGPSTIDLNLLIPTFSEIAKLDLKVEWTVDKLIPQQSLTMIHGKGGLGKTWLALKLGSSISEGVPFLGLSTIKTQVYYADFENPLAMVSDRGKILGPSEMKIWHLSNSIPPPRLDSERWELFKALVPGVIIFDTLRSSQLLDENSSKDMALIMARLKELREYGFTIILLHHTSKADSRTYKGSTAILDLCDHVLGLERVKEVGSDSIVEEDDADLPLRLGTREKTRFEPFSIFLRFDISRGFYLAGDPDDAALMDLRDLLSEYQQGEGKEPNQGQFFKLAKDIFEMNRKKFLRLLRKGEGKFWVKSKFSKNNERVYCPLVSAKNQFSAPQISKNNGLSLCSSDKETEGTTGGCSGCPRCSPPIGGGTGTGTTDPLPEKEREDDDQLTY